MMHVVLHRLLVGARVLRTDLSEMFEAVRLRCLAKERAERFGTVTAHAAALVPFGSVHASVRVKRVMRLLLTEKPLARSSACTRGLP